MASLIPRLSTQCIHMTVDLTGISFYCCAVKSHIRVLGERPENEARVGLLHSKPVCHDTNLHFH